jgi:uncharacterized protein YqgC (DUF456 family)
MRDNLIATVRTIWPALIGHAVAWLLVITSAFGLDIDSAAAQQSVGWVLTTVVYVVGTWLQRRTGDSPAARLARFVGTVLLGSVAQPRYDQPTSR